MQSLVDTLDSIFMGFIRHLEVAMGHFELTIELIGLVGDCLRVYITDQTH
jgi:hypothetical protein